MAFGCLTRPVWKNYHLSIRTQVRVYEACVCVLSVHLYGAESYMLSTPSASVSFWEDLGRSSLQAGRLHDAKANLDKLQQKRLWRQ